MEVRLLYTNKPPRTSCIDHVFYVRPRPWALLDFSTCVAISNAFRWRGGAREIDNLPMSMKCTSNYLINTVHFTRLPWWQVLQGSCISSTGLAGEVFCSADCHRDSRVGCNKSDPINKNTNHWHGLFSGKSTRLNTKWVFSQLITIS